MRRIGIFLVGLCYLSLAEADFINGGFESPYTNVQGPNVIIPSWNSTGYLFSGYKVSVLPPKSLNDIKLSPSSNTPFGISDVIENDDTQSLFDYFLKSAEPISTLKLPEVQR